MSTTRLPNPLASRGTDHSRGGQHAIRCRDTTRYKTAESAVEKLRGRVGLVPVLCDMCKGWHLRMGAP